MNEKNFIKSKLVTSLLQLDLFDIISLAEFTAEKGIEQKENIKSKGKKEKKRRRKKKYNVSL